MYPPKPVLDLDDLRVEAIDVVPAVNLEDLTQGYGITELGASSNYSGSCDNDCNYSCNECNAMG